MHRRVTASSRYWTSGPWAGSSIERSLKRLPEVLTPKPANIAEQSATFVTGRRFGNGPWEDAMTDIALLVHRTTLGGAKPSARDSRRKCKCRISLTATAPRDHGAKLI